MKSSNHDDRLIGALCLLPTSYENGPDCVSSMFATEMRIAFEHAEFSGLWVVEPPNYFLRRL